MRTPDWIIMLWTHLSWILAFHSGGIFAEDEINYKLGCVWRSSISSTMPEEQEVYPTSNCDRGQLLWYYPHGSLVAHFTHEVSAPFTVCLTKSSWSHLEAVYNGSSELRPATRRTDSLETLASPEIVCVHSVEGLVQLNFMAQQEKTTVAEIAYSKETHVPP